jgi:hypothetical protein
LLLLPRWVAIFTEAINWDEFTMLARVDQSLRTGGVLGGGRPGLVTLILIPFVRNCVDSVSAAVHARMLWFVITAAYLCGVFFLVRNWFRFAGRGESGRFEGAVAVALLAFLPAFVTWSMQVRSDQAALAAAVWGGVCLLSERRHAALLTGVLFGLAILCSQKAVYPAALCGLMWVAAVVGRLQLPGPASHRSELTARAVQITLVVAGSATTLAAYAYLVPAASGLVEKGTVMSAWQEMQTARARVGYHAYALEATRAPLHLLLVVSLLVASARAFLGRTNGKQLLLVTCWAILLLGTVIVVVHGSSYPYFIMTAGLFPAVALGLSSGHLASFLRERRSMIVALALVALILGSARITLELLDGTQANQRDTLRWLKSSGLGEYQGFQVDGALICLSDVGTMRPLSHELNMGQMSSQSFDDFVEELRRRPVAYVLDAEGLLQFPGKVRRFWSEHYLWYYGSVSVAGFKVSPEWHQSSIDVFVPGIYRWVPAPPIRAASLEIDGSPVAAGRKVSISVGRHHVSTHPAGAAGTLVLAIPRPVANEIYSFIDARQIDRLYSKH